MTLEEFWLSNRILPPFDVRFVKFDNIITIRRVILDAHNPPQFVDDDGYSLGPLSNYEIIISGEENAK